MGLARRPRRRRHGRLGGRGRARPRDARRPRVAPDPRRRATYGLPAWTTPDTTVLCASYSGNTEETLACYEAAGALGATRIAVTSGGRLAEIARADGVPVIPVAGGFQPRAAVAYMTVAALEVARLCGAGPRMGAEIDVAADHLEQLVVEWGAEGAEDSEAKALARTLHDSVPVIAGAGLTSPIAYRWKTQFNENAKIPSFTHELPELCHNEVVGWTDAALLGRFSAIFLDDSDTHPRIKERIALTRELIGDSAVGTPRRALARPHRRRARALARPARRSRVALRRGAARHRPDAGRRARDAEGAPRGELVALGAGAGSGRVESHAVTADAVGLGLVGDHGHSGEACVAEAWMVDVACGMHWRFVAFSAGVGAL